MLDAAEAFLLGGRNQLAVTHKRRSGVGVKRIAPEDDQVIKLVRKFSGTALYCPAPRQRAA